MSYIANEIVDQIEKFIKTESDVEVVRGIISSYIRRMLGDARRFEFIDGVIARTIGFHGDKSEWIVDGDRLFGVTFRNAIDRSMKKCQFGSGAET